MGKKFDRLPLNYRQAIDDAIQTVAGTSHPDVAEAYREYEGQSFSECHTSAKDDVKKFDFVSFYSYFGEGWRLCLAKQRTDLLKDARTRKKDGSYFAHVPEHI